MKARAHGESDVSSDHDSDPSGDDKTSGGEGSASSPTDDGSSEGVLTMSARAQDEALETQAERQWSKDVLGKQLHSGVWPWLAQACATLEDVENN